MTGNRKYKDSVFCDYMSDGPKLVELYNAVYGANYPSDTPVEINTLDNVLYMDRVNDISFTLDGKYVVLLEQQSTLSRNMPLRMGIYIMRLYEKMLPEKALYREETIPLFTPKFIVLYNGDEDLPEYTEQRISDAFLEEDADIYVRVRWFNIRRHKNIVPELLQRCKSLDEYSILVEQIEEYRKQNGISLEEAIRLAIMNCRKQGVMADYLKEKGSEVLNMIFTEWNWDDALEVRGEERYARGLKEGEKSGIRKGELQERIASIRNLMETLQLSVEQAMDALKIPQEERENYKKMLHNVTI